VNRRARLVLPLVMGGVLALGGGAVLVSCASGPDSGASASGASAAAGAPVLRVVDPYIPQPASPDVAAGYLIVQNDGGTADRLVALSSPLSGEVMLHRTTEGSMEHLDGLDVPAGGRGVLARGGNHIMFTAPRQQLRKGDTVELTLTFERSGSVTVTVPVLGLTERPGDEPGVPAGRTVATLTPSGAAPAAAPSSAAPASSGDHGGHGGH
jgi:copper(I)-binding protein